MGFGGIVTQHLYREFLQPSLRWLRHEESARSRDVSRLAPQLSRKRASEQASRVLDRRRLETKTSMQPRKQHALWENMSAHSSKLMQRNKRADGPGVWHDPGNGGAEGLKRGSSGVSKDLERLKRGLEGPWRGWGGVWKGPGGGRNGVWKGIGAGSVRGAQNPYMALDRPKLILCLDCLEREGHRIKRNRRDGA